MVFASPVFLGFLAVTLLLYWGIAKRGAGAAKALLIVASLVFYGSWKIEFLPLLTLSMLANYGFALLIRRYRDTPRADRIYVLAVVCNIVLLGVFKYTGFVLRQWNAWFTPPIQIPEIVLPIAISFFTFQQIGFLTDMRNGEVEHLDFWNFVFMVVIFPHLIAGPIVSQRDLLPQLAARKNWELRADQLAIGFTIFAIGLFKKTALIDPFVPYIDNIYDWVALGRPVGFIDGWIAALGYGFQIYFDFSGYSDMAIGLAFLFGIRLPMNFFSPYKATSISDFWRRWHITLSHFLRNLLFMPLSMSRFLRALVVFPRSGSGKGLTVAVLAVILTMTIGGLWHGAGWTFVIWGLLHGLYLAINNLWAAAFPRRKPKALGRLAGGALTFFAVTAAWVLFRSPDMKSAMILLKAMAGLTTLHEVARLDGGLVAMFPVYALIVWFMPNLMQVFRAQKPALDLGGHLDKNPSGWIERRIAFDGSVPWAVAGAVTFLIAWFALSNLAPFIYFQF